jgi:uncharacterized membrane protein YdjX (TVP38/TMEM64 family)
MKRHLPKIIFGIFLIIFFVLFFTFELSRFFSLENIARVQDFILQFSVLGPVIVILLYVVFNLAVLPTLFFNILSGYLYGPVFGSLIAWIGMTVGLMASFSNIRWIFRRDFISRFGSNKTVVKMEEYLEEYGNWLVVIMRLLFIVPYNLQNIAYGLSSISPIRYLVFSGIGIIPLTVAYAIIGHLINQGIMGSGDFRKYTVIIGALIAFFIAIIVFSVIAGKKLRSPKAS